MIKWNVQLCFAPVCGHVYVLFWCWLWSGAFLCHWGENILIVSVIHNKVHWLDNYCHLVVVIVNTNEVARSSSELQHRHALLSNNGSPGWGKERIYFIISVRYNLFETIQDVGQVAWNVQHFPNIPSQRCVPDHLTSTY